MITRIQALVPQITVRHAVFCRGTVRVQAAKAGLDFDRIPPRKTMVVKRESGEVVEDGITEAWTKIPKYHRGRKKIPGAPREVVGRPMAPEVASGTNSFPAGNLEAQLEPARAVPGEEPSAVPGLEPPGSPAEPVSMDHGNG